MKLKLSKKKYISLIFFAVISIVLVVFVVRPLIEGIKENSQQLLLEKEAQLDFVREIENFQNFREIYQEIEPNLEKAKNLFAISEPPIEFINFLEQTAFNSSVLLEISSVDSTEAEGNNWAFSNFRLSASGSFSDFSKFIEKLENGSYLIEIYDFGITSSGGDFGTEEVGGILTRNVSSNFSLRVFTK